MFIRSVYSNNPAMGMFLQYHLNEDISRIIFPSPKSVECAKNTWSSLIFENNCPFSNSISQKRN